MMKNNKYQIFAIGLVVGLLLAGRVAEATAPSPFICMFGHSDTVGFTAHFRTLIPPFTVIEGTSTDADFIKELRADGKVYAAHVINPTGESAAQLVARWRSPFDNTLGGQLPGGYDAISIDELHGGYTNGTAHSNAVVTALANLRALYPTKQIYVAMTWHYGSSPASYSDQLNAANNHADMLIPECYIREGNASYGWLTQWADNLKNTVANILNKTVFGLYIPQGGFVADDSTSLGYWGHLDEQFHRIKNDADASGMPGIMLWVYYRSQQDLTPDYCARLINHYYIDGQTSYFGDGSTSQLISNPQFENTTSGWTLTPGSGGSIGIFNYNSVSVANDHDDFALASHGSYGLRMIGGSGTNTVSTQMVGLDVNKTYTVSAWVISASGTANKAKVAITETDGTVIQSNTLTNVGTPPNYITTWNEWSRIIFHFVPTASTIKVVLSDEGATAGQTLYWDFIELEDAFDLLPILDPGDFNGDGLVDCNDLQILAELWLQDDAIGQLPDTNRVAHWALGETSGSVAADSVGGKTAALTNFPVDDSQWVTGTINGALAFDGVDDVVVATGYKGITGTASRTVSAWIKTTTTGEIITWGTNATGEKWIFRVQDSNGDSGTIRAEVAGGYIVGSTYLLDNQWHHVAAVLDSDGSPDVSEVKLYVDGSEEMISAVLAQAINTASGQDVQIGAFTTISPRYFTGLMDDVRIYNIALTAEELTVLDPPGPCSGADLTCDGITNYPDFANFAQFWLTGIIEN